MNLQNWRQNLRRVKNLAIESPVAMFGGHAAALSGSTIAIAGFNAIQGAAVFAASGISLTLYVSKFSVTDLLSYEYAEIFHTKSYGRKVIVEALTTLEGMGVTNARDVLKRSLHSFKVASRSQSMQFRMVNKNQLTASGIAFDKYMPKDATAAHDQFIQEALHVLLTYLPARRDSDEALPENIQHQILARRPEWVILNPIAFTTSVVDTTCPGLLEAVKCIQALDYPESEQLEALRNWRESQAATLVNISELPTSFV